MKITYTSVREPRWANEEKTKIDCIVKFSHMKKEVPFTAASFDTEEHGREIFHKAAAAEFGVVSPKQEKSTTFALQDIKFPEWIAGWPEIEKFLQEVNSENAKGTNRGVVLVWASMIEELLGKLLEAFFVDHSLSQNLIKKGMTFSSRIKLAFSLGCISEDEFNICNHIRDIRNMFAHEWNATLENTKFKEKIIPVCQKIYNAYDSETFNFIEDLDYLTRLLYAGACGRLACAIADRIVNTRHQRVRKAV